MKSRIKIDERVREEIVERLAEAAGIDPDSLEEGRIRWALECRCRHLGLSATDAYMEHLRSTGAEIDELIDALVIQETRFFRDPAVFEHLREWARDAAGEGAKPLRILSAPCSTGQEAYSLAATLRLAGLPLEGFVIDAFDISRTALARAQGGVYPAGALENLPAELQRACGELRNHEWRMHAELCGRIRFDRRNLAEADALGNESEYHLILCRNLFIYLHANARTGLAKALSRALLPGGRLIVGPGDRVPELNARFVPLKPATGFGFTHKLAVAAEGSETRSETRTVRVRPTPRAEVVTRLKEHDAPWTAVEFHRRAVEYMEHGNLRQAERRCRQALYLAPGYLPALELLQALWQVHPNERLRRALTRRIHRVHAENESMALAMREADRGTA